MSEARDSSGGFFKKIIEKRNSYHIHLIHMLVWTSMGFGFGVKSASEYAHVELVGKRMFTHRYQQSDDVDLEGPYMHFLWALDPKQTRLFLDESRPVLLRRRKMASSFAEGGLWIYPFAPSWLHLSL